MEQKRAVALLKNGFQTGRISHAYLFYGQKGGGKYDTARAFTQLLLCENPANAEPCGVCGQCKKVAGGNHPDVTIIIPDGLSLKIEQIRTLQEKVYYQPYEGKYKVIILRRVHLFTKEAANSILKVLEEPPEKTVFLLLAEDLLKVPITIQSRCQLLPFVSSGFWGTGEEPEEVRQAKEKYKFAELITGIKQGGYREIFGWAETFDKKVKKEQNKKEPVEMLCEWLIELYRDRVVWLSTGCQELLSGPGDISQADTQGALQALAAVNKTVAALAENANNRLNIDVLLMKLKRIEQKEVRE